MSALQDLADNPLPEDPAPAPNNTAIASGAYFQGLAQQGRDAEQAAQNDARQQRSVLQQLADRSIPSYVDETGAKPVTDESGAPLTNYDKKNSLAWDSQGNPRSISYDSATGAPQLKDPFEGKPEVTDPADGSKYKIAPGLPWQYTGQDPEIAKQAQQDARDRAISTATTALGRQLTMDEHLSTAGESDYKFNAKQLSRTVPTLAGVDDLTSPEAVSALHEHFDQQLQSPEANSHDGWFSWQPNPAAMKFRQGVEDQRQSALAKLQALQQQRGQLDAQADRINQQRQVASAMDSVLASHAMQKIPGLSAIPGLEQPGDGAGSAGPQAADTQASQAPQPATSGGGAPSLSQTGGGPSDQDSQAGGGAAGSGQAKLYTVNPDTSIQFDPMKPLDSLHQAASDGLVSPASAADLESKLAPLQAHADELAKLQADHPALAKALSVVHGASLGAAASAGFMGGAAAAAGPAATVAGATLPIAEFTGPATEIIGGLIGAGLSVWAAHKAAGIIDKFSDALKPFENSAELHPNYDAAGNFLGMVLSGGVGSSVKGLSGLGNVAAQNASETGGNAVLAAAGAVGKRMLSHAVTGAAVFTPAQHAFDFVADKALDVAGIDHQQSDQSASGWLRDAAVNAGMSSLFAGHGITLKGYTSEEMVDLMRKGLGAAVNGQPLESVMSQSEVEAFNHVNDKLAQTGATGHDFIADPNSFKMAVKQAVLAPDRPIGDAAMAAYIKNRESKWTPQERAVVESVRSYAQQHPDAPIQQAFQSAFEQTGHDLGQTPEQVRQTYGEATKQPRISVTAGMPEQGARGLPPEEATSNPHGGPIPQPNSAAPGSENQVPAEKPVTGREVPPGEAQSEQAPTPENRSGTEAAPEQPSSASPPPAEPSSGPAETQQSQSGPTPEQTPEPRPQAEGKEASPVPTPEAAPPASSEPQPDTSKSIAIGDTLTDKSGKAYRISGEGDHATVGPVWKLQAPDGRETSANKDALQRHVNEGNLSLAKAEAQQGHIPGLSPQAGDTGASATSSEKEAPQPSGSQSPVESGPEATPGSAPVAAASKNAASPQSQEGTPPSESGSASPASNTPPAPGQSVSTPRKWADLPDPTPAQATLMDDRSAIRYPANANSKVYVRSGPVGHEWLATHGGKVAGAGFEATAQAAKEAGLKSVAEFSKQPVKPNEPANPETSPLSQSKPETTPEAGKAATTSSSETAEPAAPTGEPVGRPADSGVNPPGGDGAGGRGGSAGDVAPSKTATATAVKEPSGAPTSDVVRKNRSGSEMRTLGWPEGSVHVEFPDEAAHEAYKSDPDYQTQVQEAARQGVAKGKISVRVPRPKPEPITREQSDGILNDTLKASKGDLNKAGVGKGRIIRNSNQTGPSGLSYVVRTASSRGELHVNAEKFNKHLNDIQTAQHERGIAGTPEEAARAALGEEATHAAQDRVAESKGKTLPEFYKEFPDEEMPEGWEKNGEDARPGWKDMPQWKKRAEFVRMVLQGKWTGTISEAFYRHLQQVLKFLKQIATGSKASDAFKEHLAEVEKAMGGLKVEAKPTDHEAVKSRAAAVAKAAAPSEESGAEPETKPAPALAKSKPSNGTTTLDAAAVTKDDLKNWPGDRVTRNPDGTPKTFYHGSKNADELSRTGRFDNSKADPKALYGPGFYFTDDPKTAGGDGETKKGYSTQTGGVVPAHLDVRNPFNIDADMPDEKWQKIVAAAHEADPRYDWDYLSEKLEERENDWNIDGATVYRGLAKIHDEDGNPLGKAGANELLKKIGYDGITHIGGANTDNDPHRVVIAFDPHQIVGKFGGVERKAEDSTLFAAPVDSKQVKPHAGVQKIADKLGLNYDRDVEGHHFLDPKTGARFTLVKPESVGQVQSAQNRANNFGIPKKAAPAADESKTWTALQIKGNEAKPFTDFTKTIAPEDLYRGEGEKDSFGGDDYGIEKDPHITALYGLETQEPEDVRKLVENFGPVTAKVGGVSLFENPGKPYDVVKASVSGPDLTRLNAELQKLPNSSDFPKYTPHITLAYVKKGEGAKYVGKAPFTGKTLTFDTLRFKNKAKEVSNLPMVSTPAAPAPSARDYNEEAGKMQRSGPATEPVEPTSGERQRIKQAFADVDRSSIHPNSGWSHPIADVLEKAGLPLTDASKGKVVWMAQHGDIEMLSHGDWSLSDARNRAWAVKPDGGASNDTRMLMKMAPESEPDRLDAATATATKTGSFYGDDLKPTLDKFKVGTKEALDGIINLVAPTFNAPTPTLDAFMKMKGGRDKVAFVLGKTFDAIVHGFNQMPQAEQVAFVDAMKRGQKQASPELDQIAALMSKIDEASLADAHAAGLPIADKANHFRVIWDKIPGQDPADYEETGLGGLGRRPIRGSRGMAKRATLPDMSTGVAMGGVPRSWNPAVMFKMAQADIRKWITAAHMWNWAKDNKVVKFLKPGEKMPEGFTDINDAIARVQFKSDAGMVQAGKFVGEENFARLFNNHVSRDFVRESALGSGMMWIKNAMTAAELSLSPFHAIFESLETVGSSIGLGIQKMFNRGFLHGDVSALKSGMIDILTAPWSFISTANLGAKAQKAVWQEGYFGTKEGKALLKQFPDAENLLREMFEAGAKLDTDQDWHNNTRQAFVESLNSGNYIGAALRALPALNEWMMKPLFEHYIPNLKVGMFLREYSNALAEADADIASGKKTRSEVAREVWRHIEDRFGEMNFDNLFWDRTFKSGMQLFTRSVTWKLGSASAFAKVLSGQGAEMKKAFQEKRAPVLHRNMAWLLGMAALTAALGFVIQRMFTGKSPENLTDLVFPQIDKGDSKIRVSLPTYLKDLVHLHHSPTGFITSSFASWMGGVSDLWRNQDYYGLKVRNEDDPVLKQMLDMGKHEAKSLLPFSVRGYKNLSDQDVSQMRRLISLFALTPAPRYISDTPAETLARKYASQAAPVGGRTQAQADKAHARYLLEKQIREGKAPQFDAQIKAGNIRPKDIPAIQRAARLTPLQALARGLPVDKANAVFAVASPAEKAQIGPIVERKRANAGEIAGL